MSTARLLKIGMLNLVLVAFLGVLMRYKIGFEFTLVNQKNLQLAHSGFAFSGFVSFLLMIFIVDSIKANLHKNQLVRFNWLIYLNLLFAYTTCIFFIFTGYSEFAITSQVVGLIAGMLFIILLLDVLTTFPNRQISNWYKAGSIFYLLSIVANIWLIYMFISGKKTQYTYLAATYWFLHFQYNGWFFFGCMGLLFSWLETKQLLFKQIPSTFWFFALSCIPAYGLSVLWLNLPIWLYIIVIGSAFMQLIGMIQLCKLLFLNDVQGIIRKNGTVFLLLLISFGALFCKILLQLGSTVPFISKLAFGFRPIVIAYLHLVLLAFTVLFLLGYTHLSGFILTNKKIIVATKLFAVFVVLNEIILGIQGIASLSYTVIPMVNEILLFISFILLMSAIAMLQFKSAKD
jgi:hypothetical protein